MIYPAPPFPLGRAQITSTRQTSNLFDFPRSHPRPQLPLPFGSGGVRQHRLNTQYSILNTQYTTLDATSLLFTLYSNTLVAEERKSGFPILPIHHLPSPALPQPSLTPAPALPSPSLPQPLRVYSGSPNPSPKAFESPSASNFLSLQFLSLQFLLLRFRAQLEHLYSLS